MVAAAHVELCATAACSPSSTAASAALSSARAAVVGSRSRGVSIDDGADEAGAGGGDAGCRRCGGVVVDVVVVAVAVAAVVAGETGAAVARGAGPARGWVDGGAAARTAAPNGGCG